VDAHLAQVGSHDVLVRVTDAGGLTAEQRFTITVKATNGAPIAVAGLLRGRRFPPAWPPGGLVSWYPGDGSAADIVGRTPRP